jgi:hypothetical protein
VRREDLEHIIRAAGDVLSETEVIIVGSQAILGAPYEDLPKDVTLSVEVDVIATHDLDGNKALRLNGAIGEMTRFDEMFGYYAEGVEEGLCRFPERWRERLLPVETPATNGVTGLCVEPHDLCASKLLAGRDKDLKYVASLLRSGHVKVEVLIERLQTTDATADEFERVIGFFERTTHPATNSPARRALRKARSHLASTRSAKGPSGGLPS